MTPVSLPVMPLCLIRDEIPLPPNYQPPEWTQDLLTEWRHDKQLKAVNAYPTQSVLLQGPSGVGKSTAARYIAGQLGLPMVSMMLFTAIESYMGSTDKNIETAIRYAKSVPCVLLMDELDSVSAARDAKSNDVGEIWRITNTFIQLLDGWHGQQQSSLLIGTTNMAHSIDGAIRRRFELEVLVPMPTTLELSRIAGVPVPDYCRLSHAEMHKLVLQAKRSSVIHGTDYAITILSFPGKGNA